MTSPIRILLLFQNFISYSVSFSFNFSFLKYIQSALERRLIILVNIIDRTRYLGLYIFGISALYLVDR